MHCVLVCQDDHNFEKQSHEQEDQCNVWERNDDPFEFELVVDHHNKSAIDKICLGEIWTPAHGFGNRDPLGALEWPH